MKHFINVNTDVVASLDDDEATRPESHLLNPEEWVPVHIHADGEVPPGMRYVGAGQYAPPAVEEAPKSRAFRVGSLVAKLTVTAFTLAVLSFAVGLLAFAIRFAWGALT